MMKTLLSLFFCLLLCSCASSKKRVISQQNVQATLLENAAMVSLEMSELATEGPAGIVMSDCGFTWVIPRTNRYTLIEVKDYLHNGVIRYLHDREVYGDSLVIWPGPIDVVNHPELPETLNPAAYFHTRYTTNHP